jgi:hypothetical protein
MAINHHQSFLLSKCRDILTLQDKTVRFFEIPALLPNYTASYPRLLPLIAPPLCLISGFRRHVNEISSLLGCYTT